jgi:hypothetical protein
VVKTLKIVQNLALSLAVAIGGLGLFCGLGQSAHAQIISTSVDGEGQCNPQGTERDSGAAPCWALQADPCKLGGEAGHVCTSSPNGSNCSCK